MIYDQNGLPICRLHEPEELHFSCSLLPGKQKEAGLSTYSGKCSAPQRGFRIRLRSGGGSGGNCEYFWPGSCHTLVIPVLRRLMQVDPEFKAKLDYVVKPCFKNQNSKTNKQATEECF